MLKLGSDRRITRFASIAENRTQASEEALPRTFAGRVHPDLRLRPLPCVPVPANDFRQRILRVSQAFFETAAYNRIADRAELAEYLAAARLENPQVSLQAAFLGFVPSNRERFAATRMGSCVTLAQGLADALGDAGIAAFVVPAKALAPAYLDCHPGTCHADVAVPFLRDERRLAYVLEPVFGWGGAYEVSFDGTRAELAANSVRVQGYLTRSGKEKARSEMASGEVSWTYKMAQITAGSQRLYLTALTMNISQAMLRLDKWGEEVGLVNIVGKSVKVRDNLAQAERRYTFAEIRQNKPRWQHEDFGSLLQWNSVAPHPLTADGLRNQIQSGAAHADLLAELDSAALTLRLKHEKRATQPSWVGRFCCFG